MKGEIERMSMPVNNSLVSGMSDKWGCLIKSINNGVVENVDNVQEPYEKYRKGRIRCPYGENADSSGTIVYNGVAFSCDSDRNRLCLGDVSNPKKCLSIHLTSGSLVVNTDNLDSLSQAMGMFTPEDVNLIMRAISEYQKIKDKLNEIEDDKMNVGQDRSTGNTDKDKSAGNQAYLVLKNNTEDIFKAKNRKDSDKNNIDDSTYNILTKDKGYITSKGQVYMDNIAQTELSEDKKELTENRLSDITEDMILKLLMS